jgi:hypothetical protein
MTKRLEKGRTSRKIGSKGINRYIRYREDIVDLMYDCEWALWDDLGYGSGFDGVGHD